MATRYSNKWLPKTPKSVLAYTAGIVDGEGCIYAQRQDKKCGYANEAATMAVRLHIVSTDRAMLDFIVSHFEAGIIVRDPRAVKPGYRQSFFMNIASSIGVARFLTPLLPFLIIKQRQAQLAIAIAKTFDKKGKQRPLTEVAATERKRLWKELRLANH